jgi:pimeloyl-ACP methyl ester carboxylesterase
VRLRFGGSAAVYIDGDPQAPVTLLLLHGCGRDATAWDPVVDLLVRPDPTRSARVVRVEHRGHGHSPLGRASISMPLLGEDIGSVIDAVCPTGPVVVAGHSMGGMAVLGLARARPDLFADGTVRGVLLAATSPGGRRPAPPPPQPAPTVPDVGGVEGFSLRLGFLLGAVSLARGVAPATVSRYFRALMDHHVHDGLEALQSSSVRVLVGDRDRWTPPGHAQRLVDLIPGARLRVIPGAGHYLPGSHPALLAEVLTSLAGEAAVTPGAGKVTADSGARRRAQFLNLARVVPLGPGLMHSKSVR